MAALMRLSRFFAGFKSNNFLITRENILRNNYCSNHEIPCRMFSAMPNRVDKLVKIDDTFNRHYATNVALATSLSSTKTILKTINEPSKTNTTIDRQLKQLDGQVRRWGRIDKEQVENLMQLVKGPLKSHEAAMLLRCTGSLLAKESPSERNEVFEKMWKKIISIDGGNMNIQVYNAMLRVKLENRQTFAPAEVLSDLETVKQLVPNRVTYQLMMAQFCELGDIEGASKILEHMKSQNLPINETVLNSLLKGQMRKGDLVAAQAVMATMSEYGLDPTAETYKTFMCCLAEKGDLTAIKQVLADAEKNDVTIEPRNLYDVILSLVDAGHEDKIDDILDFIKKNDHFRYNQDALNSVFHLVANGHDEDAYKVFLSMDRSSLEGQERSSIGLVLLRNMIIKGRPLDKVLDVWQKLKAQNLITDSIEMIAAIALKYQRSGYILDLFDRMKQQGCVIKQHYFWPVFHDATERKDVNGIYTTVSSLIKHTTGSRELIVGTLHRWAVKGLLKNGENLNIILDKFKAVGISEKDIQTLHVSFLVSEDKFDEAARLIDEGCNFSPAILKTELASGFHKNKRDFADILKMLKSIEGRTDVLFADANSSILLSLLTTDSISSDDADKLMNAWAELGLKVNQNIRYSLKRELTNLKVPEETIAKVDCLLVDSKVERDQKLPFEELKEVPIEQLESMLEKVKQSNDGKASGLKKWLLSKYCKAGMVSKADELKASLDSENFIYSPDLLRQLGNLAVKDKGDLDEALRYLKELEKQYPSYKAYATLVLPISSLLLKNSKYDEAINLLKSYSSKHKDQMESDGYSEGYQLAVLSDQLLQTCMQNYDPQKTMDLTKVLFDNGFVKKGTLSLLDKMMTCFIQKSDSDELVSALEYCITNYSVAPKFTDIFQHLIVKEDADRLQKAVDLVTSVHGEMTVLLQLVFCFIECGKVKQARKIIETPGLRSLWKPLKDGCERYIKLDKEKELEQLVEITKKLPAVDRDEMLLQLMRLHAKHKDTKKMLEVFSLYEEEGIFPRDRTLRYVAKVLESQNEPVPFAVPLAKQKLSVPDHEQQISSSDAGDQEKEISCNSDVEIEAKKAIESGNISKVMDMKKKFDAEGDADKSLEFVSTVAKILLRQYDLKTFRMLIYQLSQDACIDSLLEIRKLSLPKRMIAYLHQRLFVAYLHANKAEEIVNYLKEKPEQLPKYLSVNMLSLLAEKNPELLASVEALINNSLEHGRHDQRPFVNLYNFYMTNGHGNKAQQLLEKQPSLRDKINLTYVCKLAKKLKSGEEVLRNVIKLHKSDQPRRLVIPFNHLLKLKCEEGDWEQALKTYQEALVNNLTFDDMWVWTLQSLQSVLQGSKQPLPWQPGMLEKKAADQARNKRRHDDSSSSDNSDSDTETKKV